MKLLISAIFLTFTSSFVPIVSIMVASMFVSPPLELKSDIEELKKRIDKVNKREEFAKYAKLMREHDKLMEALKDSLNKNAKKRSQISIMINYTVRAVVTIISLFLFWAYRSFTVIVLPTHWTSPCSNLLSWPAGVDGGISFPVWFLICGTSTKMIVKSLTTYLNNLKKNELTKEL